VSHFWWGTNQVVPDDREGAPMLTETPAMYTEMIYEEEKGFSEDQPLYRVTDENTHISYSKGAVIMVQLSELIGEANVNTALRNFLQSHKYPGTPPLSTDLLNEILRASDPRYHVAINKMFMEM
jgi:hypothetical protein